MKSEADLTRAVERYGDTVRRLCFLYLKSAADTDDIFQTVFLKYYLEPRPFENEEHEKAWLIRVTINACKDWLRSLTRHACVPLESVAELSYDEPTRDVLSAVLSLPQKYRDAVYLFYYEGYTAREIAALLHKRENTVYTLLSRGRERLRELLGGDDLD